MNSSLSLRPFTASDTRAGHILSQAVGWGHLLDNWDLMQKVGRGQLAVGDDGSLQGVAMWWPYGATFATIGMVIVAPELQGRGIGRRLMSQVLEDIGYRRIQLIATPGGQPLYESLGFRVTGEIISCNIAAEVTVRPVVTNVEVRSLQAADHATVRALDSHASQADRSDLLTGLFDISKGLVAERDGKLVGYILCHKWGKGHTVGPLVANDEHAALALLSTAIANTGGLRHIDLDGGSTQLMRWLESSGLQTSTKLNVMQRGSAAPKRGGPYIFSLASQGLG